MKRPTRPLWAVYSRLTIGATDKQQALKAARKAYHAAMERYANEMVTYLTAIEAERDEWQRQLKQLDFLLTEDSTNPASCPHDLTEAAAALVEEVGDQKARLEEVETERAEAVRLLRESVEEMDCVDGADWQDRVDALLTRIDVQEDHDED